MASASPNAARAVERRLALVQSSHERIRLHTRFRRAIRVRALGQEHLENVVVNGVIGLAEGGVQGCLPVSGMG